MKMTCDYRTNPWEQPCVIQSCQPFIVIITASKKESKSDDENVDSNGTFDRKLTLLIQNCVCKPTYCRSSIAQF